MPNVTPTPLIIDPPQPYEGILFGIDFGLRRIGIAVGQTLTQHANPLKIILAQKGEPDWGQFEKLIKEWQPLALIIGIPLNMDGTTQPMTYKARRFAMQLKNRYQLPVHGMDERLTSREVRQNLFEQGGYRAIQKHDIDALAAKIILEEWMKIHV
ncbi:MAG: Holliday junction resolvase RuvX [Gammaproteobacteria bacterium]